MSKYLVLFAALLVLAVACNKKEEAAPTEETTTEQAAPTDTMDAGDESVMEEDAETAE